MPSPAAEDRETQVDASDYKHDDANYETPVEQASVRGQKGTKKREGEQANSVPFSFSALSDSLSSTYMRVGPPLRLLPPMTTRMMPDKTYSSARPQKRAKYLAYS